MAMERADRNRSTGHGSIFGGKFIEASEEFTNRDVDESLM